MKAKKTILIADDDTSILDSMQLLLEESGYDVRTTVNGDTVREMQENPDLLLLDIWMSGWNGKEICTYLKAQPKTKSVPIILVSANKDTEKIALEAGADDFISKPFDLQTLLSKIERHIN